MLEEKTGRREGQLGRGTAQCFMSVPDNTSKVHGETLFSLTYGAEAVIPAEVNLCST